MIDSALDAVRDTADAKGVILDRAVEANLAPLRGDPDRLQQVVWNLLSNAIKFTPNGGRVSVVARAVGTELEIAVSDNGKGIESEFLPFVFDRFRQSATGRARGGLGLVVDDDDDARQLLAFVLEQCHAEVLTAASTEEALAAGFDRHVAKPVEPAVLAEIVAELATELRRVRAGGVATGRV